MYALRATAAIRRPQYADSPDVRFRWAAAQRVLTNQVIVQNEINVRTRRPGRQFRAIRGTEGDCNDAVSDRPRLPHHQIRLMFPDDGLSERHCPHPVETGR